MRLFDFKQNFKKDKSEKNACKLLMFIWPLSQL